MARNKTRWARHVALVGVVAVLSGCGLPRSGPSKAEIFNSSVQRKGDAFIVDVDDRVVQATALPSGYGFSHAFRNAGIVASDTIRPGDILNITVWENVDRGILSGLSGNATTLNQVQVDDSGFIFVPYAGRIRAAGNSPEALRRVITRQLEQQTPDPQVLVGRAAGDGATVSIVGNVGGQGVYAIERPTRTLTAMLARAGGITIDPETVRVSVIRSGQTGTIWLQDLYADPGNDIALRPDDRILVEQDARYYTALGATGGQRRVPFDGKDLTAIEAIAQVGGLSSSVADPTGLFVLRDESAEVANRVLGRRDLVGEQRMIYLLNLTEPSGVFHARDFKIRDEDTIYVTEAPFVQWQKILGSITGTLGPATAIADTVDNGL